MDFFPYSHVLKCQSRYSIKKPILILWNSRIKEENISINRNINK